MSLHHSFFIGYAYITLHCITLHVITSSPLKIHKIYLINSKQCNIRKELYLTLPNPAPPPSGKLIYYCLLSLYILQGERARAICHYCLIIKNIII